MPTNYRKMGVWTAIAGCDRDDFWDAIMHENGVQWDLLGSIGISEARDGIFVNYLRGKKNVLAQPLSAAREALEQARIDLWTGPNCPTDEEIKALIDLAG